MRPAIFYFFLLFHASIFAQPAYYTTANAHSHNDYEQAKPFWLAYDYQFGSIEADIFLEKGQLIVAHDKNELLLKRSFESLYLDNILICLNKHHQYPYSDTAKFLQLLIDIKTDSVATLQKLIEVLKTYPTLTSNSHLRFVITGNRPNASSFNAYPAFIWFDGILSTPYADSVLGKIKLKSDDFRKYSHWNGRDSLPVSDRTKLIEMISDSHKKNMPVRFWNAPDAPAAWKTFMELQVDYINTDHISHLSAFLESHHQVRSEKIPQADAH